MDKKVFEEFEKNKTNNEEESLYPEHDFIVSCLRIGLKLEDLKLLSFIDVFKLFISYIGKTKKPEEETRFATQEEIQKMVAKM